MSDFTTYTDTALYAELAGRESTLGLKGMTARLNDREISKIRRELESRKLPMKQPRGPRTGTFYVLSYRDPPFNVGCYTPTRAAVSSTSMRPRPSARLR